MRTHAIKGALSIAVLLVLAACSENPTQPTNVKPQMYTAPGTTASWYFEGVIASVWSGDYPIGAKVTGTATFTTMLDPVYYGGCSVFYESDVSFTYTLNGVTREMKSEGVPGDGAIHMYGSCGDQPPNYLQINATPGSVYWALELFNPNPSLDVPLTPPAIVQGEYHNFWLWDSANNWDGFRAELTLLQANPSSKDACKNDGWKKYGFRNQGLCVSFIETGKDTRR